MTYLNFKSSVNFLGFFISLYALSSVAADPTRDAILSMEGCHNVKFEYNEIFTAPESTYVSKPYYEEAQELAVLDFNSDREIHFQRMLIVPGHGIQKHWRDEWTFEPKRILTFLEPSRWGFKIIDLSESQGKWSQRVLNVEDSPRYEALGAMAVYPTSGNQQVRFWESTVLSPLPRREFKQRNDYQALLRRNRIEFLKTGWIHEQDNQKLKRISDGSYVRVASEKGLNRYEKINPAVCTEASNQWSRLKRVWNLIQTEWKTIQNDRNEFTFKMRMSDGLLYEKLFTLAEEWTKAVEAGKDVDFADSDGIMKARTMIQAHLN